MRTIYRAKADRESTIKTLAKYTTVTDPVLLVKTYGFYMTKVLERAPYINMQGMQNAIDDLALTLPRPGKPNRNSSSISVSSTGWKEAVYSKSSTNRRQLLRDNPPCFVRKPQRCRGPSIDSLCHFD